MNEYYQGKISEIENIAIENGWEFLDFQPGIGMISFFKDESRINIYITKMTVATCINHPKKGKTQLFRRNVSLQELKKIFKRPRIHTNKGYYTR